MRQMLLREPSDGATAFGLLRAEHFQMAYVTNDLERACDLFRDQLGICAWASLGGPTPDGSEIYARFAWVGTLMYEVICARGPGSAIFMDRLPQTSGFALEHHHLGFLIQNERQWNGVLTSAAHHGWGVPHIGASPLTKVCFVDVPALGHYLEYLFATQDGLDFFASVPRS